MVKKFWEAQVEGLQETNAEVGLLKVRILLDLLAQELQSLVNFFMSFLAIRIVRLNFKERKLPIVLHTVVAFGPL